MAVSLSNAAIAILCALSFAFSEDWFTHDASSLHCCHNDDNAKLAIVSASLSDIFFGDADDQDVGRIRYNHSSDSMAFFTNGSEKVRIESGGDVSGFSYLVTSSYLNGTIVRA